jgi:hypothetical protein
MAEPFLERAQRDAGGGHRGAEGMARSWKRRCGRPAAVRAAWRRSEILALDCTPPVNGCAKTSSASPCQREVWCSRWSSPASSSLIGTERPDDGASDLARSQAQAPSGPLVQVLQGPAVDREDHRQLFVTRAGKACPLGDIVRVGEPLVPTRYSIDLLA